MDERSAPPRVIATAMNEPEHAQLAIPVGEPTVATYPAQPQVVYGEPTEQAPAAPAYAAASAVPTAPAGQAAAAVPAQTAGQKAGSFAKIAAAKAAEAAQRAAEASARASAAAATRIQAHRAEREAKEAAIAAGAAGTAGATLAQPAAPPPPVYSTPSAGAHPAESANSAYPAASTAPAGSAYPAADAPKAESIRVQAKPQRAAKPAGYLPEQASYTHPPAGGAVGPGASAQPAELAAAQPAAVYRDAAWAVAWGCSLVCVIGILAGYGSLLAANSAVAAAGGSTGSGARKLDVGFFMGTLCACLIATALFAAVYLELMFRHAKPLVTWTLYGSLVASFVIMIVAFATAGAAGVLFLVMFLLNAWCVLPYPAMLAEVLWALLWLWTYSVAVQADANWAVHIFLLLVFFWTSQGESAPVDTVKRSFHRAATYSLGSICLGSLLVAIVKTVRALVSQARSQAEGGFAQCMLCCVDCLLGCLDRAMQYFNHYAYTRVALYGVGFVQ
ncbi:plasma-membrane choline transporter-domain-containing protein, partial [Pavlovales sp. CCMP2436]